jgi:hypothetical protein
VEGIMEVNKLSLKKRAETLNVLHLVKT